MKPTALAIVLLVSAAGCRARGPAQAPPKPAPRIGDKRFLTPDEGGIVWSSLDALRLHRRMVAADAWTRGDAAVAEAELARVGMVGDGDRVEVVEVGGDFALIEALAGGWIRGGPDGRPVADHVRGYVAAWWK